MNASKLYVGGFAHRGEQCSWNESADDPRGISRESDRIVFNSRRMAGVTAYAMEAAAAALAVAGSDTVARSKFGVVTLTHNGPCVYSEDFYKQIVRETSPQLASPMLFTESVLNIVATHVSLALQSHSPVYALHTDLAGYFTALDTLFLLADTGQFDTAVLCVFDEFSPLPRRVFPECRDYPGARYVTGAVSSVLSKQPFESDRNVYIGKPQATDSLGEFIEAMLKLKESGADLVLSSYSPENIPDDALQTLRLSESSMSPAQMNDEQGFLVGRTAELLDCVRHAINGHGRVLIQCDAEYLRWAPVLPSA